MSLVLEQNMSVEGTEAVDFSWQQNANITVEQVIVGGGNPGVIDVSIGGVVIDVGDITTFGYAWLQNLDDTNDIRIGPECAGTIAPFLRLSAGAVNCIELEPGIVLRAQAITAASRLWVLVFEK